MIEQADLVEVIGYAVGSFASGYVSSILLMYFKKAAGFIK